MSNYLNPEYNGDPCPVELILPSRYDPTSLWYEVLQNLDEGPRAGFTILPVKVLAELPSDVHLRMVAGLRDALVIRDALEFLEDSKDMPEDYFRHEVNDGPNVDHESEENALKRYLEEFSRNNDSTSINTSNGLTYEDEERIKDLLPGISDHARYIKALENPAPSLVLASSPEGREELIKTMMRWHSNPVSWPLDWLEFPEIAKQDDLFGPHGPLALLLANADSDLLGSSSLPTELLPDEFLSLGCRAGALNIGKLMLRVLRAEDYEDPKDYEDTVNLGDKILEIHHMLKKLDQAGVQPTTQPELKDLIRRGLLSVLNEENDD